MGLSGDVHFILSEEGAPLVCGDRGTLLWPRQELMVTGQCVSCKVGEKWARFWIHFEGRAGSISRTWALRESEESKMTQVFEWSSQKPGVVTSRHGKGGGAVGSGQRWNDLQFQIPHEVPELGGQKAAGGQAGQGLAGGHGQSVDTVFYCCRFLLEAGWSQLRVKAGGILEEMSR